MSDKKYIEMQVLEHSWLSGKTKGEGMDAVASFLQDVSWYSAEDFRQWLLDPTIASMESNASLLIRKNGQILIGDKYATDFYAYASLIPTEVLVDLLLQWEKMCEMRGLGLAGAYITYDGARFHVDPQAVSTPKS